MSDWGFVEGAQDLESAGAVTAGSNGTSISTPGGTHTKGSWTQMIASTSIDAVGLLISGNASGSGEINCLFDIGVGAAGSEQVFVPNLQAKRMPSADGPVGPYVVFVRIPAGSRVSCRLQHDSSITLNVCAVLIAETMAGVATGEEVEVYGANTGTSKGTLVDAGAAANTKGAWTQLTASAAIDSHWLMLTTMPNSSAAGAGSHYLVDIGIGAAAAEQVVVPNIHISCATSYGPWRAGVLLPCHIPAGSRVSLRCQSTTNLAGSRELLCTLHAMG